MASQSAENPYHFSPHRNEVNDEGTQNLDESIHTNSSHVPPTPPRRTTLVALPNSEQATTDESPTELHGVTLDFDASDSQDHPEGEANVHDQLSNDIYNSVANSDSPLNETFQNSSGRENIDSAIRVEQDGLELDRSEDMADLNTIPLTSNSTTVQPSTPKATSLQSSAPTTTTPAQPSTPTTTPMQPSSPTTTTPTQPSTPKATSLQSSAPTTTTPAQPSTPTTTPMQPSSPTTTTPTQPSTPKATSLQSSAPTTTTPAQPSTPTTTPMQPSSPTTTPIHLDTPTRIWSSPFQAPQLSFYPPQTGATDSPRKLFTNVPGTSSSDEDELQPSRQSTHLLRTSNYGDTDRDPMSGDEYTGSRSPNLNWHSQNEDDEPDEYFGDHTGFWNQVKEWKQKVLDTPLSIKISSPQQAQRTLLRPNPPVTYLLETEPQGCKVRRRYSDFEWLQEMLSSKYLGLLVPPIPEKRALGNTGEEFVRQRMRGLDNFLKRALAIPFLRADKTFLEFLTTTDANSWDRLRRAKVIVDPTNESEVQWRRCLHRHRIPEDSEVVLHSLKNQLRSLQELLTKVVHAADNVVVAAHHHAEAQMSFKYEYMFALAGYQQAQLAQGSGAHHAKISTKPTHQDSAAAGRYETGAQGDAHSENQVSESLDSLPKLLLQMGHTFSAWSDLVTYDHHILRQLFAEVLQYEMQCVRGLKRLIKNRDKHIESHNASCSSLRKAETQYRNYVNSHRPLQTAIQQGAGGTINSAATVDPVKLAKLQLKVDQTRARVRRAATIVQQTTKGLFYSQVNDFAARQMESLTRMTGVVAAAYLKHVQYLGKVWQGCLDSFGLDWREMSELAEPMLQVIDVERRAQYRRGKVDKNHDVDETTISK